MRIGELSERTQTSRRLLRYYEEQGLIVSARCANGYRSYDARLVDRVMQIRGLLDAGLPTRIIKQILPCLDKPRTIYFPDATPDMIATLEHERDRMTARIACLTRNRDAIAGYLDAVRGGDHPDVSAEGADEQHEPERLSRGHRRSPQAENEVRPNPVCQDAGMDDLSTEWATMSA